MAMPLGVPWSKRMRIVQRVLIDSYASTDGRRVEAAGGKFKHRLNLLPGHMKLLDDFLDARTRFEIFKYRSGGHPGSAKNPRAAAPVRNAFDGGALGPIEICHNITLLSIIIFCHDWFT